MQQKINAIADTLLSMNPDPIPRFVILKEFKGLTPNDCEYQSLYKQVCVHKSIKSFEDTQNERGFWPPFHGYTEGTIRRLLSFGLDKEHACLKRVSEYLIKVLNGEDDWNQYEKQDNPLWYPKMFMPLVNSAMLSLIDKDNPILKNQRQQWSYVAKESFVDGVYSMNKNIKAIDDSCSVYTKRPVQPFNYYSLLLLAPDGDRSYIDDETDQAIVDHLMKKVDGLGYVYNNRLCDMVNIDVQNRDSRDFWHWVRALSIIKKYHGWSKYKDRYNEWILSQANADGLWEFPKKFGFTLSNSWRGKSKVIDSSVFVAKMLNSSLSY